MMTNENPFRKQVLENIQNLEKNVIDTSRYIHEHPETGGEEYKSSARLISELEKHGFRVEKGVGGMDTAFKAKIKGRSGGPRIAFLAEYDALGSLGHACGHNFIGTASAFAGIALNAVIRDIKGEIVVVGTPGEENLGGKIILLENGVFDDIDVAMMVHPSNETRFQAKSLAAQVWEFEFLGKPAHAAAMPWRGVNALDALIQMFVSVDQMRKQQLPTVRTPGIITYGGERANIVPERAVGRFSCRGENFNEFLKVIERVKRCAEGAALSAGAKVEYRSLGPVYKDMKTNQPLANLFEKNWRELGGIAQENPDKGQGSLDIGNISYVMPCIHPSVKIAPPDVANHTKEFARLAGSPSSDEPLLMSVKTLALTALDVLMNPEIFAEIKNANNS